MKQIINSIKHGIALNSGLNNSIGSKLSIIERVCSPGNEQEKIAKKLNMTKNHHQQEENTCDQNQTHAPLLDKMRQLRLSELKRDDQIMVVAQNICLHEGKGPVSEDQARIFLKNAGVRHACEIVASYYASLLRQS